MESITHRLSAAGENHDDPMLKFNTQQKCHVKFDGKTHGKTMWIDVKTHGKPQ